MPWRHAFSRIFCSSPTLTTVNALQSGQQAADYFLYISKHFQGPPVHYRAAGITLSFAVRQHVLY